VVKDRWWRNGGEGTMVKGTWPIWTQRQSPKAVVSARRIAKQLWNCGNYARLGANVMYCFGVA
jgi:hypothetical protein